jgi:hypothetical protein
VSYRPLAPEPGLRGGPPVHSTSKNPAYTLSDGLLAISFDNLGAGAHLALSIAATSHRSKHRRNHLKKHLPARAGDTRTRSTQNATESTLPRPQASKSKKRRHCDAQHQTSHGEQGLRQAHRGHGLRKCSKRARPRRRGQFVTCFLRPAPTHSESPEGENTRTAAAARDADGAEAAACCN